MDPVRLWQLHADRTNLGIRWLLVDLPPVCVMNDSSRANPKWSRDQSPVTSRGPFDSAQDKRVRATGTRHSQSRALIICADDLGLSPGVNRGIEEAHRRGVVTATSIMPNVPLLSEALDVLARNPRLDPGVHLCLGPGPSVAPSGKVPSLLGSDGRLRAGHGTLWMALISGIIREAEVEHEWRAQIEKVIDAGVKPTHLDGHGHVHFFPSLFRLTIRLAREYGIPAIRGGRPVARPLGRRWWVWSILLANWLLSSRHLADEAVSSPRWLVGVSVTGRLSRGVLRRVFRAVPEGVTELTCHPGYEDEELRRSGDQPLPDRAAETQALCGAKVPEGVALTTFAAEWGTAAEGHGSRGGGGQVKQRGS